jgi:hypothetical protein
MNLHGWYMNSSGGVHARHVRRRPNHFSSGHSRRQGKLHRAGILPQPPSPHPRKRRGAERSGPGQSSALRWGNPDARRFATGDAHRTHQEWHCGTPHHQDRADGIPWSWLAVCRPYKGKSRPHHCRSTETYVFSAGLGARIGVRLSAWCHSRTPGPRLLRFRERFCPPRQVAGRAGQPRRPRRATISEGN